MFLMHRNRLVNETYSRKGCVTRFSNKRNPRLKRVFVVVMLKNLTVNY